MERGGRRDSEARVCLFRSPAAAKDSRGPFPCGGRRASLSLLSSLAPCGSACAPPGRRAESRGPGARGERAESQPVIFFFFLFNKLLVLYHLLGPGSQIT